MGLEIAQAPSGEIAPPDNLGAVLTNKIASIRGDDKVIKLAPV
jgi:hypothetical protein